MNVEICIEMTSNQEGNEVFLRIGKIVAITFIVPCDYLFTIIFWRFLNLEINIFNIWL